MVSFKVITSALALASGIAAQATPAQLLVDIKTLTLMTQALQPEADKISLLNGPLIIIGQGPFPNLIRGFTDIVTTGTTSLATQRGSAPIPAGADAEAISEAWTRVRCARRVMHSKTNKHTVRRRSDETAQHHDRKGRVVQHRSSYWSPDCGCAKAGFAHN